MVPTRRALPTSRASVAPGRADSPSVPSGCGPLGVLYIIGQARQGRQQDQGQPSAGKSVDFRCFEGINVTPPGADPGHFGRCWRFHERRSRFRDVAEILAADELGTGPIFDLRRPSTVRSRNDPAWSRLSRTSGPSRRGSRARARPRPGRAWPCGFSAASRRREDPRASAAFRERSLVLGIAYLESIARRGTSAAEGGIGGGAQRTPGTTEPPRGRIKSG